MIHPKKTSSEVTLLDIGATVLTAGVFALVAVGIAGIAGAVLSGGREREGEDPINPSDSKIPEPESQPIQPPPGKPLVPYRPDPEMARALVASHSHSPSSCPDCGRSDCGCPGCGHCELCHPRNGDFCPECGYDND